MVMRGSGRTDVGKLRDHNEDSFFVDNDLGLFVVADGMGGAAAGELASAIAIETVVGQVREARPTLDEARATPLDLAPLKWVAEDAVQAASKAIFERAGESHKLRGMGCTLTVLIAARDQAVMAHVGDSRLYLVRDHEVTQLTSDHTLAQELVSSGILPQTEVKGHCLEHVLTRAVGIRADVVVDSKVLELVPGDQFLICSDGLTEYVTDLKWLAEQLGTSDFDSIPEALIRFANEAGGEDNITVVVARVEDGDGGDSRTGGASIVTEAVPLWGSATA